MVFGIDHNRYQSICLGSFRVLAWVVGHTGLFCIYSCWEMLRTFFSYKIAFVFCWLGESSRNGRFRDSHLIPGGCYQRMISHEFIIFLSCVYGWRDTHTSCSSSENKSYVFRLHARLGISL